MHKTLLLCLCFILSLTSVAQEKKETKADSVKKEKKKDKNLPLEIGRRIPIKTDEGTWMSLDVSISLQSIRTVRPLKWKSKSKEKAL